MKIAETDMHHPSSRAVISLYEKYASEWAKDRGKDLIEKPWLDRFLSLIPDHYSVLDMGCGSGLPIASYLIQQGRDVTGVDSSPSMIAMCSERFPAQRWLIGDMRTITLNSTFNGILAFDSFFHLTPDDQRRMFPVFRTHAKPGTALMFNSGPRQGEAIGSYRGEALYHSSLDAAEYEGLLASIGFEVVDHVAEDAACGGRTVWLAKCGL